MSRGISLPSWSGSRTPRPCHSQPRSRCPASRSRSPATAAARSAPRPAPARNTSPPARAIRWSSSSSRRRPGRAIRAARSLIRRASSPACSLVRTTAARSAAAPRGCARFSPTWGRAASRPCPSPSSQISPRSTVASARRRRPPRGWHQPQTPRSSTARPTWPSRSRRLATRHRSPRSSSCSTCAPMVRRCSRPPAAWPS